MEVKIDKEAYKALESGILIKNQIPLIVKSMHSYKASDMNMILISTHQLDEFIVLKRDTFLKAYENMSEN